MDRTCDDCGGVQFVQDWAQGDLVCTSCGLVAEERMIDDRPEWRNHVNGDETAGPDPSRVGAATGGACGGFVTTHAQASRPAPTVIGRPSAAAAGGRGKAGAGAGGRGGSASAVAAQLHRVQRQASVHDGGTDAAMRDDMQRIDFVMRGPLCGARDDAIALTRQLYIDFRRGPPTCVVKDQNKQAAMAACAYFACRRRGAARAMVEVATLFGVDRQGRLSKMCTRVREALRNRPEYACVFHSAETSDTRDTLGRMISGMASIPSAMTWPVKQLCNAIDAQVKQQKVMGGKLPIKLNACVIAVACGHLGVALDPAEVAAHVASNTLKANRRLLAGVIAEWDGGAAGFAQAVERARIARHYA
jgi:transcription initiation factor TFIIB